MVWIDNLQRVSATIILIDLKRYGEIMLGELVSQLLILRRELSLGYYET